MNTDTKKDIVKDINEIYEILTSGFLLNTLIYHNIYILKDIIMELANLILHIYFYFLIEKDNQKFFKYNDKDLLIIAKSKNKIIAFDSNDLKDNNCYKIATKINFIREQKVDFIDVDGGTEIFTPSYVQCMYWVIDTVEQINKKENKRKRKRNP